MKAHPRFVQNRLAAVQLAKQPEMRRYLENVAQAAAVEIDRRAPRWIKRAGGEFEGRADSTAKGYEGVVVIRSSFYHLEEWGSRNNPPHPFIRPGVQTVLSRVGGRWKAQ